ncbi:hypothetical protein SPONL_1024 [uncultured Candidatus Thioglobus sp.]|nr:hypothetical protein SPONL_1024 [uncultured Candidatus Thioglobus sp.]
MLAKEWQTFNNAQLIKAVDGDSFYVNAGNQNLHLRLYFVDCPETNAGSRSDASRIREQTRYFGVNDVKTTMQFGKLASEFTQQTLAQPFTVHTAFSNAMGRSKQKRIYAMISINSGEDLGSLLVKNGLCRPKGVGKKTYADISRKNMFAILDNLQDAAMLKKIGIWAKTDADKIVELRTQQLEENMQLDKIRNHYKIEIGLIDINTSTAQELQSIKGIGAVIAKRIIAARPYKNIAELTKVRGIGEKTYQKLAPFFK